MVIYIEDFLARQFEAKPHSLAQALAAGGSRTRLPGVTHTHVRPSAAAFPIFSGRTDAGSPPSIRSVHELMQAYAEASLI